MTTALGGAELVEHPRQRGGHPVRVRDVDRDVGRARHARRCEVERGDTPPLGHEALGARAAHAARGAGDDRDGHWAARGVRTLRGAGVGQLARSSPSSVRPVGRICRCQIAPHDVDARVGRLELREAGGQGGAARRVEPAHADDQLRLLRVHRQLRAPRRREADEVQVLDPDRQRQPGRAERHALVPADQPCVEERQRHPEPGRPQDRVELAARPVDEVHATPVEPRDARGDRDAAVLDPVRQEVVDDLASVWPI